MADSVQMKTLQNKLDDLASFINGQVHAEDSADMWEVVFEFAGTWQQSVEDDIERKAAEAEGQAELDEGLAVEVEAGEPGSNEEEGEDGPAT